MSNMNAADIANKLELTQTKRRQARIDARRAEHGGGSMKANGGSTEYKSSWDYDSPEGTMASSGTFDPNSSFAKEYYALEEDTGSRVDDEEGWRQIKRESPPKTAKEYEAFAKKWSNAGFDVKAIDMDGDNFTHANIAIKPKDASDTTPSDEEGLQSPEMSEAKAYTRAMFDYRRSGDDAQSITGYNPVTGEYGFKKSNGETAASQFNKAYKAQLKYELNLKPESLVFKGGKDDQQDGEAVQPNN